MITIEKCYGNTPSSMNFCMNDILFGADEQNFISNNTFLLYLALREEDLWSDVYGYLKGIENDRN